MEYKVILSKLIEQKDLTEEEASAAIGSILEGLWTPSQIGAFLGAMATKGESVSEIAGAARTMRSKATPIHSNRANLIDTCGTGGDHSNTFNISTTTAFVVAGAGVGVAKHGNRSISSKCGSADVLEALGVQISVSAHVMEKALEQIGICFMFAPAYHGATKYAMPTRKELGVRTIFNMLGPLTNPAQASCQLLGVFKPELTEMFALVLRRMGSRHALVVHGLDGLDELSLQSPSRVSELKNGSIETYEVNPSDWFKRMDDPMALVGGDAAVNARIVQDVLQGKTGPARDVVVLNAAAALIAADVAEDFSQGILLAQQSIDQGHALSKLNGLIEITQAG